MLRLNHASMSGFAGRRHQANITLAAIWSQTACSGVYSKNQVKNIKAARSEALVSLQTHVVPSVTFFLANIFFPTPLTSSVVQEEGGQRHPVVVHGVGFIFQANV